MPNYRRAYVPGGTFFFTLVTNRRARFLCDLPARPLLGSVIRRCHLKWPVNVAAIALLPNHLHVIWSLPSGDSEFSKRWGWIKKEFTKQWLLLGGVQKGVSDGRRRERRRGVWQPRFWEHAIRNEKDFERHFDYVHYNPVKHGLVPCPHAWPWSSFHRWVSGDVYPKDWACSCGRSFVSLDFHDIEESTGEPA